MGTGRMVAIPACHAVVVVCVLLLVVSHLEKAHASAVLRGTTPCPSHVLVCDDFESYTGGDALEGPWSATTTNGSVTVDAMLSYSGSKAVKVMTKPADRQGIKTAFLTLGQSTAFAIPGNILHGRFMFYLEQQPIEPFHWTWIQAGGPAKGRDYRAVLRYGAEPALDTSSGDWRLLANYDTPQYYQGIGPGSDCFVRSDSVAMPSGVWACAEFEFDASQENAKLKLRLDGREIKTLNVDGIGDTCVNEGSDKPFPWTSPLFDKVQIGFESYSPDAYARTMWIDDVVISTRSIGCPAAA